MRRFSWIILLIIGLSACKKEGEVTIRGYYPEGASTNLSLEMLNIAEVQFIDSVKISDNGKFKFKFQLNSPELISLHNNKNELINLLAFPGDNITLDIKSEKLAENYTITGSEESLKIQALEQKMDDSRAKLDSLAAELNKLEDKEGKMAKVLTDAYYNVYEQQKKHNIKFVVENLQSLSSVYALYQRITPDIYLFGNIKDLQYFKITSDSLKLHYPNSTLVNSLVNDVQIRLSEYNNSLIINEYTKNNSIESGHINLSIEDSEGKIRELQELKGKVILVNFWASWDKNSVAACVSLKGIYNEYHKRGFEIYSVSLDQNRIAWKSAIDFEEFNWINVCELTYPQSYAASAYNISAIPSNYLINREGEIVAKNIQGTNLATWLDNLL